MKFGVMPRYKPLTPSVAIMRRNVPTIVCCDLMAVSAVITVTNMENLELKKTEKHFGVR